MLVLGVLSVPLAATAQTNHMPGPLRARQLIGMKVEDSDGQNAGTIRNLVLNMNTGNLRYAVIGTGGFFGVDATLKLAPATALSAATTKRQTLALHATTTQWRNAPAFESSELAEIGKPGRASEISHYFQVSATRASGRTMPSLSKTGREGTPDKQSGELKFTSDLIGKKVVNTKQEKIGDIADLLVSFNEPHTAFVILSGGRLFHREYQYAIPLTAINHSDNKFVLDVDATTMKQAPPFDQAAWEAQGTNTTHSIYRYPTPSD
jgi:sporulation protein YlmC with PRC-barrel domain